MRLEGKVTFVTGGAQGIGKEIALAFAKEGSDVAIGDINPDVTAATVKEIESLGRKALGLQLDVTDGVKVEESVNKILDKFGKVDILVNNAGITRDGLLLRMSEKDWDMVISVNLKGTFNCTKTLSKVMI